MAVPLVSTLIVFLIKAQNDMSVRIGLGLIATLALYSFGENLEILAYLYWPGLVLVGIALRQRKPTTYPDL